MDTLIKLVKKPSLKIIGLMSGTSCDGIDLALCQISGSGTKTEFELNASFHKPYTSVQKTTLQNLIQSEISEIKKLSQVNFYLASIWAEAIDEMLKKAKIPKAGIDLIGSHGHTFYHQPDEDFFTDRNIRSTLQLGDPAVIAQLTGITTIGDFRVADVALRGQGAPLVPYVDWLLFSRLKESSLILNIGGIANFTFIPVNGKKEGVIAFDTGPGNILIDQLMQRLYQRPFDKNGEIAFMGNFSDRLFNLLLKTDAYPLRKPPKSTGREHYGKEFVINLLKKSLRWRLSEPDVIHTVSRYTAYTIWQAAEQFIKEMIDTIYVGGGGSRNPFILVSLADYFKNTPVKNTSELGIDADFKEAICFAVLANELIKGHKTSLPRVTGSSKSSFLGKICLV